MTDKTEKKASLEKRVTELAAEQSKASAAWNEWKSDFKARALINPDAEPDRDEYHKEKAKYENAIKLIKEEQSQAIQELLKL
jgi:hypothetical protein